MHSGENKRLILPLFYPGDNNLVIPGIKINYNLILNMACHFRIHVMKQSVILSMKEISLSLWFVNNLKHRYKYIKNVWRFNFTRRKYQVARFSIQVRWKVNVYYSKTVERYNYLCKIEGINTYHTSSVARFLDFLHERNYLTTIDLNLYQDIILPQENFHTSTINCILSILNKYFLYCTNRIIHKENRGLYDRLSQWMKHSES